MTKHHEKRRGDEGDRFHCAQVIRTSSSAHQTEKRGPPELPAGQNRPKHGCIHASPNARFAQARANHRHDSSTEKFRPPSRRHPHTTNQCAIATTVAAAVPSCVMRGQQQEIHDPGRLTPWFTPSISWPIMPEPCVHPWINPAWCPTWKPILAARPHRRCAG